MDWWTIPHVLAGGALGFLLPLLWVLGLLVAFEAFEAGLRRIRRGGKGLFAPESGINIVADVLFGMLGAVVAKALAPHLPV